MGKFQDIAKLFIVKHQALNEPDNLANWQVSLRLGDTHFAVFSGLQPGRSDYFLHYVTQGLAKHLESAFTNKNIPALCQPHHAATLSLKGLYCPNIALFRVEFAFNDNERTICTIPAANLRQAQQARRYLEQLHDIFATTLYQATSKEETV